MATTHKNRVQMTVTGTPGTGTITLNAASSGYQTFASAYGADATADVLIVDGTAWEVARGCAYTNSGTTLGRGTLESSSTGSAISLTSAAIVSVIATADFGNRLERAMQSVMPGGRLTLTSGVPFSAPTNAVAVSGQDTSADTITVTAHGWAVCTMVTSSATSGGLTAGTQYYVGNVTTNTVSLHTTVAAALAGTSKVDITGAVSATITASGVANSTIYYTPYVHNTIPLWDGTNWTPTTFSETLLALSGLTSGKPYDVFGYLSSGSLALELLEWTNDTTRATAVTLQDGRYCKDGDKTRLLLGTIYTTSTTTTEDSLANAYVANLYNQIQRRVRGSSTASHTYTTGSIREYNGGTSVTRANFIQCLPGAAVIAVGGVQMSSTTSNCGHGGLGINSTGLLGEGHGVFANAAGITSWSDFRIGISGNAKVVAGKNYVTGTQFGVSGVTWISVYFSTNPLL